MSSPYISVQEAVEEIRQKKMLIVQDHREREDEGDIYIPAVFAMPQVVNFMITFAKGLLCMPITEKRAQQLNLPLMVPPDQNQEFTKCSFTIPVDARNGIRSGISAFDRAKTIEILCSSESVPDDLVHPGHIFPLIAKKGGLKERQGHTEAAVELAKLAGLDPSGVICEIIDDDGQMRRGERLIQFALEHNLNIITIDDILNYLETT